MTDGPASAGQPGSPDPAPSRGPRAHRGGWMAGHTVIALFSVLVLLVTGVNWFITWRFDAGLADNRVDAIVSDDTHLSTATAAPGGGVVTRDGQEVVTYPAENILLLGSDTRAGVNADSGNSDSSTEDGVANSDSLMLAHISSDRKITVLSIPRDTMIPAPTCNTWNSQTGELTDRIEPVSEGTRWHINSAFSVGGPKCTVRAVQALTGLRIDRVIGIDFAGFKNMVDALGGITVNICGPIVDGELQTVVAAGGVQTIQGDQALSLVRARKVIGDDDSDLSRIRRQQVVLSAILRQVTDAGTLVNPVKLNSFLQAFADNTFTSEGVTLDSLVTLAQSLGTLDPARVTFYTLPTVPSTRESGALEVDDTKAPAVFSALLNDQPLPGEQPTATTPADPSIIPAPSTPEVSALPSTLATDPADVVVQVVNASGRTGVATAMMTALNDVGFAVTEDDLRVQDAEQSDLVVEYATGQQDAALTVAATLEGAGLVEVPGLAVPVRLIVGSSWDGVAQPVSVGADTPTWITAAAAPTVTDDSGSTGDAPSGDASTLGSTDLPSVNAGQALCA